jgi:hypothetical protein
VQGEVITRGSIAHLLDTMHAGSDMEINFSNPEVWNDYNFNKTDDNWDTAIVDTSILEEALLVPPSALPDDDNIPSNNDLSGNGSQMY